MLRCAREVPTGRRNRSGCGDGDGDPRHRGTPVGSESCDRGRYRWRFLPGSEEKSRRKRNHDRNRGQGRRDRTGERTVRHHRREPPAAPSGWAHGDSRRQIERPGRCDSLGDLGEGAPPFPGLPGKASPGASGQETDTGLDDSDTTKKIAQRPVITIPYRADARNRIHSRCTVLADGYRSAASEGGSVRGAPPRARPPARAPPPPPPPPPPAPATGRADRPRARPPRGGGGTRPLLR